MEFMNFRKRVIALSAVAAVAAPLAFTTKAHAVPVGLELSLLIDVSGSVDANEFALQRDGYVNAFQSAAVQNAILGSQVGSIAVNFIVWSGANQQSQQVGWTLIDSAAASDAFATAVSGIARSFSGLTAPGSAINFAAPLFTNNGFEGLRNVIDVSGDGQENDGANTANARNAALAGSMTQDAIDAINGLAIGNVSLLNWYNANIVGGTGGFAIQANDFGDFASAIQQKLIREITGVPEPMTIALFGFGLAALGMARRRRA